MNKTLSLNLRVEEAMKEALVGLANENGRSITAQMEHLIRDAVERPSAARELSKIERRLSAIEKALNEQV